MSALALNIAAEINHHHELASKHADRHVDRRDKPIRGDYVDVPLRNWGLDDPASVAWRWCKQDRPLASALAMGAQHG